MKDQPTQPESQSLSESKQPRAADVLALHDETDREAERLRRLPSAIGLPGLGLFLVLFVFVLKSFGLGILTSLVASLLLASPGLLLLGRDFRRTRRLRLLKRMIEVVEDPRATQGGDASLLSSNLDKIGGARPEESD